MSGGWWRPLDSEPRLSQGDIIASISFAGSVFPRVPLRKSTAKGSDVAWHESSADQPQPDKEGFFHLLARGREALGLVLTHSCQLDKTERRQRVIVAPISASDRLESEVREVVMTGHKLAFFPLPEVPEFGDSYADLRSMIAVDRRFIDEKARRVATMTPEGIADLQRRLTGFFVREAGDPTFRRVAAER